MCLIYNTFIHCLVVVVGQETDIELFKGDQSLGLSLTDSWQVRYKDRPTFKCTCTCI